jgi:hypothetical protein
MDGKEMTTRPDVYRSKAIQTRARRDAADKKFAAEWAARQAALAAQRDAMVAAKRAQAAQGRGE